MSTIIIVIFTILFSSSVDGYANQVGQVTKVNPFNALRLFNNITTRFNNGLKYASNEQILEDNNQLYQQLELGQDQILRINRRQNKALSRNIIDRINFKLKLSRQLIVIPFDTSTQSHWQTILNPMFNGQYTDKCSFPPSIGSFIKTSGVGKYVCNIYI